MKQNILYQQDVVMGNYQELIMILMKYMLPYHKLQQKYVLKQVLKHLFMYHRYQLIQNQNQDGHKRKHQVKLQYVKHFLKRYVCIFLIKFDPHHFFSNHLLSNCFYYYYHHHVHMNQIIYFITVLYFLSSICYNFIIFLFFYNLYLIHNRLLLNLPLFLVLKIDF